MRTWILGCYITICSGKHVEVDALLMINHIPLFMPDYLSHSSQKPIMGLLNPAANLIFGYGLPALGGLMCISRNRTTYNMSSCSIPLKNSTTGVGPLPLFGRSANSINFSQFLWNLKNLAVCPALKNCELLFLKLLGIALEIFYKKDNSCNLTFKTILKERSLYLQIPQK